MAQRDREGLSYNIRSLQDEEYLMVGQLISMSIVHSGIGPRCLSPLLFNSLVESPDNVVVSVDDVDDLELRSSLLELISVESVDPVSIFELAGTFRFLKDVGDVKKVAAEMAHWYVLGRTKLSKKVLIIWVCWMQLLITLYRFILLCASVHKSLLLTQFIAFSL